MLQYIIALLGLLGAVTIFVFAGMTVFSLVIIAGLMSVVAFLFSFLVKGSSELTKNLSLSLLGVLLGCFAFSGVFLVISLMNAPFAAVLGLFFLCMILGAFAIPNIDIFLRKHINPLTSDDGELTNVTEESMSNDQSSTKDSSSSNNKNKNNFQVRSKVLDTSVIIDGRIIDIASTGFFEGPFIVPNFVLREIQLISDSSDVIKRSRGRRGLDLLNQLRKRDDLEVKIDYTDYSDTREVDAKLVKLAKDLNSHLVTNDFNLNKVAQLQDVNVLNINNLAHALKPVVLPGEEFEITLVKKGKDDNQAIGYFDDGTMVVVENGGSFLGKDVNVVVSSIIQTNAGKMIFTKLK